MMFSCVYYRVFVLLVSLGQRSLSSGRALEILECLMSRLAAILSPLTNESESAGAPRFIYSLRNQLED